MALANIALELFGIGISLLLLLCCFLEGSAFQKQTGIFVAMLAVNVAVLFCDMCTWIFENQPEYTRLLYVANFFVYTLGYVFTALFTWYLVTYISTKEIVSKFITPIIAVLCFAAIIPVVISIFNHMYFSFDDGVYVRGSAYWISQVYPIAIILTDMFIVIRHRKALGLHDTLCLLSYGLLPIIAMTVQIRIYGITLLYIATTASLLIIYIMIHVEQNRHIEHQKAELAQANIAIMLSQIQPHFLYNSLSVIKNLCDTDPKLAAKVTVDFSNYLRGNLDSLKSQNNIYFAQELEHTKTFLELEKLQYGQSLEVIYDIRCDSFLIPTLTLQPIAENAVKYGMKRREHITVIISSYEDNYNYYVIVEDNGEGFDANAPEDKTRSHVGINNVRNRLALQAASTLDIKSVLGKGTIVTITIPKEKTTR